MVNTSTHAITDLEEHQSLCYSLEKVLVEKLRSVMQRMQVRDLDDIWYLSEIHEMNADFYLAEFEAKSKARIFSTQKFLKNWTKDWHNIKADGKAPWVHK